MPSYTIYSLSMNKRKRQNPAPLQSRKNPKTRFIKLRFDKTFVMGFQKTVWRWYRQNAPVLPWRKTKNPYYIFVSEVMLQQTQIPRVLVKYPEFLQTYPPTEPLAKALLGGLRWWDIFEKIRGILQARAV